MWFFNRKKLSKIAKVIYKQELTNEQKVIEALNNVIKGSSIQGDILYIEDIKLTIEAQVQNGNEKFLKIVFIINNDRFNEIFVESVTGSGNTIDEMIQEAVESFYFKVLSGITKALRD